ncbi:uncharacterized protein LOC113370401 [Ctenocephalides felis]|uniref:uncharacterized protein LOC113370401 n=1 Tax=Ctenocephalides felis TaxID=7515 RepID=UPI000E6E4CD2|nr:uncharacterized protein LOC113370401 [Ctenocephalides felis]
MPLRKISIKDIMKDHGLKDEEETTDAREERRTTGRAVATVIALGLIGLAIYHAWIRRTVVVAGIIVPALIMVLYTAWVLYTARKDKARARKLQMQREAILKEVISAVPNISVTEFDKEEALATNDQKSENVNNDIQTPEIAFHPAILQNELKEPNLQTRANFGRSISVI